MKRSGRGRRVKVTADGRGVVSHAGIGLLREMATEHRAARRGERGADRHLRGFPGALPGQVFTDLAVAIADGADGVTGI